jgi:hypothetical protein
MAELWCSGVAQVTSGSGAGHDLAVAQPNDLIEGSTPFSIVSRSWIWR